MSELEVADLELSKQAHRLNKKGDNHILAPLKGQYMLGCPLYQHFRGALAPVVEGNRVKSRTF